MFDNDFIYITVIKGTFVIISSYVELNVYSQENKGRSDYKFDLYTCIKKTNNKKTKKTYVPRDTHIRMAGMPKAIA